MNNLLLVLMLTFLGVAHAETSDANPKSAKGAAIKYVPPMRGAPLSRVGGGSRGAGDEMPRLQILAPDHTGLTIQEQPTLYWYVSKPAVAHIEVTVINDQAVAPLLERNFDTPIKAGIQKLKLSELGVKLQPDVEYRWYVSLVVDKNERSNDIIASGTILRKKPSRELQEEIFRARKDELPAIYAHNGIWYDALSAVSDLAEADAKNPVYGEQRAELLSQVGLAEILQK